MIKSWLIPDSCLEIGHVLTVSLMELFSLYIRHSSPRCSLASRWESLCNLTLEVHKDSDYR